MGDALQELMMEFAEVVDAHIDVNEFARPSFVDYSNPKNPYCRIAINTYERRDDCRAAFLYWLSEKKGMNKQAIHETTGYPFSQIGYYNLLLQKSARQNTFFNRLHYGLCWYKEMNMKYGK